MARFAHGFLVLIAGFLMNGCSNLQTMAENFNCSTEHCLRTFPAADLAASDYYSFDSIAVLPPQFSMEERTLDGTSTGAAQASDDGQQLLLEQLDRIAESYQVQNAPVQETEQLIHAINQLYTDAWSDSLTPQMVRDATPMFGTPQLPAPVQALTLDVPDVLKASASDNCCFLLSRFSGWHHTRQAKSAKVATAALFSALPGGSGVPGTMGSAISDMVIIRKSDGRVLWSARSISNGHPNQLRRTAVDFYSRVYNAKSLKNASASDS